MGQTQSIETKEIRGINFKTIYGVIVGTAVIVTFVVGCYYGLKDQISQSNAKMSEQINKIANSNGTTNAVNTFQFQIVNRRLDLIDVQIEKLKAK